MYTQLVVLCSVITLSSRVPSWGEEHSLPQRGTLHCALSRQHTSYSIHTQHGTLSTCVVHVHVSYMYRTCIMHVSYACMTLYDTCMVHVRHMWTAYHVLWILYGVCCLVNAQCSVPALWQAVLLLCGRLCSSLCQAVLYCVPCTVFHSTLSTCIIHVSCMYHTCIVHVSYMYHACIIHNVHVSYMCISTHELHVCGVRNCFPESHSLTLCQFTYSSTNTCIVIVCVCVCVLCTAHVTTVHTHGGTISAYWNYHWNLHTSPSLDHYTTPHHYTTDSCMYFINTSIHLSARSSICLFTRLSHSPSTYSSIYIIYIRVYTHKHPIKIGSTGACKLTKYWCNTQNIHCTLKPQSTTYSRERVVCIACNRRHEQICHLVCNKPPCQYNAEQKELKLAIKWYVSLDQ